MSGDTGPPPPGWTIEIGAVIIDDDIEQPEPEVFDPLVDLEDTRVLVRREDGTGEPVTIDEAWRIYRRENPE